LCFSFSKAGWVVSFGSTQVYGVAMTGGEMRI
jgi:hypothetical protein